MYYGFQGLGETYDVKLPVVGRTTIEVPVDRMVHDAMQSATRQLPNCLPTIYSQVTPYINGYIDGKKSELYADLEARAPGMLNRLLENEIIPQADEYKDKALEHLKEFRDELIIALLGMTGVVVISVGTAAWWLNYRDKMRG
jgi:hypothetical protein